MKNLKIEGTQMNKLGLFLNGQRIGTLDVDHYSAKINYTQAEFEEKFGKSINLSDLICDYYDEFEPVKGDPFGAIEYTGHYKIKFEEEDED